MPIITPEQIWQKIKPFVAKAIQDSIASAALNGITIALPDNIAYVDASQTFTEDQYLTKALVVDGWTTIGGRIYLSSHFAGDGPYLVLTQVGDVGANAYSLGSSGTSSAAGAGAFEIRDDSASFALRFVILPTTGNVGLSDNSPDSLLELGAASGRGYVTLNEITAPTIASTKLGVYAADGGTPTYLTTKDNAGNVTTLRPMGASGSGHAAGLTPDTPGSSGSSKYLCEDGSWSEPPGGGSTSLSGSGIHFMAPWGYGLAGTNQVGVATNNQVRAVRFVLPVELVINSLHFELVNAPGGSYSLGLYNDAGTSLLCDTGALTASGPGVKSVTLGSAATLPAGSYWLAWTGSNTTLTVRANTIQDATLINAGTVQIGTAANASSSGVLPATLGAITGAITFDVQRLKLQG